MDADYIVIGAGCAGLSLAVHLIARDPRGPRILLLEPRQHYVRDRTWCFWKMEPHPFEHRITHRWPRWRVAGAGRAVLCHSARHPYQHLPADGFYDEALQRIEAAPRAELQRGVHVHRVEDRGHSVLVHTSRGTVRGALAFDSRPHTPTPDDREVRLLQHFVGWFVQADRPVFDPGCATLMDFELPQQGALHFGYVLPFTETRALVEDTWFSSTPLERRSYEQYLHNYLHSRFGEAAFQVTGSEQGVLPMRTDPDRPRVSPRVYPLGLSAGVAKPSSGFAFAFIQRTSAAWAARLRGREPVTPPRPRSPWTAALDRIFLSWVHRDPARGPDAFVRMFERAPTDSVARFLSERSSPLDDARIMSALPAPPLIREAVRTPNLWMRPA
jgi:lycopene beta-cyclase